MRKKSNEPKIWILLVDCKKRLFEEDESADKNEEIQQRNSIKKQKLTCMFMTNVGGKFLFYIS